MQQKDASNTIFQLAVDLVNNTSQHIFLTGKAGTGKTTFLKYIRDNTSKHLVIVAPTGVAAINAGGVTMHSFFQLPMGMFVPGQINREDFMGFIEATDKHSLFKNIHFSSAKRQLLQELELLVIDEVSMMRCDMLDAIDAILRHYRKAPHIPFGGVQVLFIGDMFQLPPVVSNEEWKLLQTYYESPFFFSAKVVAEAPPLYIELKKIYRQSEQQFIDVLNRIRNNNTLPEDFQFLNARFDPNFTPPNGEHYITLTTHNKKAEAINSEALRNLPGKLFSFRADVVNEFSEKSFPTDVELQLKIGAQVMFIKNDSERRFYNGKLGIVTSISTDEIKVNVDDGKEDIVLQKETWKNIRYIYNKDNDEIDEELLGSFTQFPIRLAWAITVHKSQGLTFEKAIIDAGSSFAAGQVYVALSRCMSSEGLVLRSKLHPGAISTDRRIVEFARKEINDATELESIVEREKYVHWANTLLKVFDLSKIVAAIYGWQEIISEKKLPDNEGTLRLAASLLSKARELSGVAQKFRIQLEQLLSAARETGDLSMLDQRMQKAIGFFGQGLTDNILKPLQGHITDLQYTSRITKYKQELFSLEQQIWQQVQKLANARYGEHAFADPAMFAAFDPSAREGKGSQKSSSRSRPAAGQSQQVTLQLFREGKSVEEIASVRSMAISTIESHLAAFVITGELKAEDLMPAEKIQAVMKVIDEMGVVGAGPIKGRLGENYSFNEIRIVFNHLRNRSAQTAPPA